MCHDASELYSSISEIVVGSWLSTLCANSVTLSVLLLLASLNTLMATQLSSTPKSYLTSATLVHSLHSAPCADHASLSAVSLMTVLLLGLSWPSAQLVRFASLF